jgi:uncharacterized protein YybS (DUF2232 family)
MDKNISTKSLVEGAMLSAITVILSAASIYIPILGMFISFFWPIPIILLGIRHGLKMSIMATLVSGLIVGMLTEPIQALTIILGFGLIGVALGYSLKAGYSPGKTMLLGTVASLFSKVILIGLTMLFLNINPIVEQMQLMQESLEYVTRFYKSMGVDPKQLKGITDAFTLMANMITVIIPGMLLIASVLDTFLNYSIARIVLKKLGTEIESFPPLSRWQLPAYTVVLFLLGVIFVMTSGMLNIKVLEYIGVNLQMVFSLAFVVEGLALIAFYLSRAKVIKVVRAFVMLLVIFNPFFSQVAMWAGMLDILFDFRKLKKA